MEKLGFYGTIKYLVSSFIRGIVRFFKYQIVTKILFALIFTPTFWCLTQILIDSRGVFALSNSGIFKFLLTPQGILVLIFGIAFISLGILLELFGIISVSSRVLKGEPETEYIEILENNFKLLKHILDPGSLFLLIYLLILIPLTGAGTSISFLQRIKIPNFISSVIFGNTRYLLIYAFIIFIFTTISIFTIFSFHFIVIAEFKSTKAILASVDLVKKNLRIFIKKFFGVSAVVATVAGVLSVMWLLGIAQLVENVNMNNEWTRILLIALYFIQELGLRTIGLFFVPFEIHHITILFYNLVSKTPEYYNLYELKPNFKEKSRYTILDKVLKRKGIILFSLLSLILIFSVPFGMYFNDIFRYEKSIVVIGHRGGGGSNIPENSISSISKAMELGAEYVEIDLQRTLDNEYILNHDNTFRRVASDGRSSREMTLQEVKELDIGYNYPGYQGERVPTLVEVLNLTKGKSGVFIELKGETADRNMADYVVELVKEKDLTEEVVITGLNYDLINYIETEYPEMITGYIYYLAVGEAGSFNSDIVILEEYMVTDKTLSNLYFAGKTPVAWTVNEVRDLERYIDMGVYGVITDNVLESINAIEALNSESDNEYLLKMFLRFD